MRLEHYITEYEVKQIFENRSVPVAYKRHFTRAILKAENLAVLYYFAYPSLYLSIMFCESYDFLRPTCCLP